MDDLLNTLHPETFRAWLETRREVVVGTSCTATSCPVATWLADVYHRPFSVSGDVLGPYIEPPSDWEPFPPNVNTSIESPSWVTRFVQEVDYRQGFQPCEVFGADALFLLEWVMQEPPIEQAVKAVDGSADLDDHPF